VVLFAAVGHHFMKLHNNILIFFLIFSLVSCWQTKIENKCQIKRIETYNIDFEIIGGDTILKVRDKKADVEEFDSIGHILVESEVDSIGILHLKTTYKYDKIGRISEITHYDNDRINNYQIFVKTDTTIYEYWEHIKNGAKFYQVIKKIDSLGNILYMNIAGEDSIFDTKWIYEDDKKKKLKIETAYQNGILWQKIVKQYDNSGNTLSFKNYFYDNNKERLFQESTYKYNSKGLKIEETTQVSTTKYTYNQIGDVILIESVNKKNTVDSISYKYIYNDKNDWIEKKYYLNNELTKIEKRDLEYY
jgi:hypothetical protein